MVGGGGALTSEVEPDLVQIHLSVNHRPSVVDLDDCSELNQCSTNKREGGAGVHLFSVQAESPYFIQAFISFQRTTLLRHNAFLQIWPSSSSLPGQEDGWLLASPCLKIRHVIHNVPLLPFDHVYLSLLPQTAGHQFPLCRIFLTRAEAHRGIKGCVLLSFIRHIKEGKLSSFCRDAPLPGAL